MLSLVLKIENVCHALGSYAKVMYSWLLVQAGARLISFVSLANENHARESQSKLVCTVWSELVCTIWSKLVCAVWSELWCTVQQIQNYTKPTAPVMHGDAQFSSIMLVMLGGGKLSRCKLTVHESAVKNKQIHRDWLVFSLLVDEIVAVW